MSWLYRIAISAIFGIVVALAVRVTQFSLDYARLLENYQLRLGPGANFDMQIGYLLEGLSLGLLAVGSGIDSSALAMLEGVRSVQQVAETYSWWFLVSSAAFLVLGLGGSLWPADSRRFTRCILVLAAVCMLVGQIAPIMSMTATSEVPVAGTSVVKHESKSIWTAVVALHGSGKTMVAVLIVLFSLVTPATKLVLSLLAARVTSDRIQGLALKIVNALGKWSMADVFVVAMLLTVFSLQSPGDGVATNAQAEVGLWFFSAHCVLGLIGSQLIARKRAALAHEGRPSSMPALVAQLAITLGTCFLALVFLKPASEVAGRHVIAKGYRLAGAVIAHGAHGVIQGEWTSDGRPHGGADNTMVAVRVVGPDGVVLGDYGHQDRGTFEFPVRQKGPYVIVFDNVGIVRSTARSAEYRMWFRPATIWTW